MLRLRFIAAILVVFMLAACSQPLVQEAVPSVTPAAVDITPPQVFPPADVTLETPADTTPFATGIATAIDDTDPNPTISWSDLVTPGSCPANFTIERMWTALDETGNFAGQRQTITVQDTTAPSITPPSDVTVEHGESTEPTFTGTDTASDAASSVLVSFSDASIADGILRTWTATDACDNVASATQTITVQTIAIQTPQEPLGELVGEVDSLGPAKGRRELPHAETHQRHPEPR